MISSAESETFPEPDVVWDINWSCREDLKKLADKQAQFTKCAVDNSAPPQVCTNCYRQYIQLKEEEYRVQHLKKLSVDNKTCTAVIYENYVISYGHEVSSALTKRIWESAHCKSCLVIRGDWAHDNVTIQLDNKTSDFQEMLFTWRDCISNVTTANTQLFGGNKEEGTIEPLICKHCEKQFDALFDFYWKVYTDPGVDFCVDVEAMMNDTMSLWHDVLRCKDDPRTEDRHQDIRVAAFSVTLLVIVVGLFYAGSYIQTEQAQTTLIQYSRRQQIQSQRSRLLSSSTLDTFSGQTPGSSMQG